MNSMVLLPVQQYSWVRSKSVVQSNSEFLTSRLTNQIKSFPTNPVSMIFSNENSPHLMSSITTFLIIESSPFLTPSNSINHIRYPPNQFSSRQSNPVNSTLSISILQILSNSIQNVSELILSSQKVELNKPKYASGLKV